MSKNVLVIGATSDIMGRLSTLIAERCPDIILVDCPDREEFCVAEEAILVLYDYHRERDMPDVRLVLPPMNATTQQEKVLALNRQHHQVTAKRLNVRQRPVRRYDRNR